MNKVKNIGHQEHISTRLFSDITVYMTPEQKLELKKHSERIGLPMARLAAIAIDNEFDQADPFNYPCTLPTTPFIEGAYVDEAGKILRYLGRLREGASRDQLMLARRTIGILNRETFRHAYRELLEVGLVEEVTPKPKRESYKFKYPDNYKITVISQYEKKAFMIREKEREIAAAQREIEKLKGQE